MSQHIPALALGAARTNRTNGSSQSPFLTFTPLCYVRDMRSDINISAPNLDASTQDAPTLDADTIARLTDRLTQILLLLRTFLGPLGREHRTDPTLLGTIWSRVGAYARRFRALATHPPKPRLRASSPRPNTYPSTRVSARPTLPSHHGWLLRLLPGYQIPGVRSQFNFLLADPAMLALIATNPSVGRILRPLCRMLSLRIPPPLRLPPRFKQPSPKQSRAKSAPKPRPKPPQKRSKTPPLWPVQPSPFRPMLPGHRYAPLPPPKNRF